MPSKEILFSKKRGIGEVISDSFLFLKQEFRPLSKIILIYVAPFLLLYSVGQIFIQQKLIETIIPKDPEEMIQGLLPLYKNLFFMLLFNVFVQSLYIGAVYSYIEVYLAKGRGNFNRHDVAPLLFQNSLLALGANFILTIVIVFGIAMCILPGIFFANTLSLTIISLLIYKKGVGNSLMRSWNLVMANWWTTLLINIIALLMLWFVGLIFSIPSMIAGFSVSLINFGDAEPVQLPSWYWVLNGVSVFITSVLYIIPFTFWAFHYFSLEEQSKPKLPKPDEI